MNIQKGIIGLAIALLFTVTLNECMFYNELTKISVIGDRSITTLSFSPTPTEGVEWENEFFNFIDSRERKIKHANRFNAHHIALGAKEGFVSLFPFLLPNAPQITTQISNSFQDCKAIQSLGRSSDYNVRLLTLFCCLKELSKKDRLRTVNTPVMKFLLIDMVLKSEENPFHWVGLSRDQLSSVTFPLIKEGNNIVSAIGIEAADAKKTKAVSFDPFNINRLYILKKPNNGDSYIVERCDQTDFTFCEYDKFKTTIKGEARSLHLVRDLENNYPDRLIVQFENDIISCQDRVVKTIIKKQANKILGFACYTNPKKSYANEYTCTYAIVNEKCIKIIDASDWGGTQEISVELEGQDNVPIAFNRDGRFLALYDSKKKDISVYYKDTRTNTVN